MKENKRSLENKIRLRSQVKCLVCLTILCECLPTIVTKLVVICLTQTVSK